MSPPSCKAPTRHETRDHRARRVRPRRGRLQQWQRDALGRALAPDGRLQLGISAPCDHCTPTLDQSAAIVSFQPDGTDLRVDAKGIRAPIGLAYFPGTSDLFVTMNQRDDLGDNTPGDWLAVVQAGQSWGFPDCYGQGGAACTGVPPPVAVLDKHAAVDGIAIVTDQ